MVPCGSCDAVVHATKSFASISDLHHNSCAGIVDNDGRTESDISMLGKIGVMVLSVALAENLLIAEPVLTLAEKRMGFKPEEVVPQIKRRILDRLGANREKVVSDLTRQEIEVRLRTFGAGQDGVEAIVKTFSESAKAIDPRVIYQNWQNKIDAVITANDFQGALRYYKTKGLPAEAGTVLGCRYQDQVLRWLRTDGSDELVAAMRLGFCNVGGGTNIPQ